MRINLHSAHKNLYLQSNPIAGSGCLHRFLRTEISGVPLLSPSPDGGMHATMHSQFISLRAICLRKS
jgi:hypothetical protein